MNIERISTGDPHIYGKKITSKEMKEDIQMTWKEPKKESAMISPRTGNKLTKPLTIFEIRAELMLVMWNS